MSATICWVSLSTTPFPLGSVLLTLPATLMTQARGSSGELSTIRKEELKEIVFKWNKKGAPSRWKAREGGSECIRRKSWSRSSHCVSSNRNSIGFSWRGRALFPWSSKRMWSSKIIWKKNIRNRFKVRIVRGDVLVLFYKNYHPLWK